MKIFKVTVRRCAAFIFKTSSKLLTGTKLAKFIFVRKIRDLFINYLRNNLPVAIKVNDNLMYLDSKDALDLSIRGAYEKFEIKIFKQEIKLGDIVLDIGAHIGYYTLVAAKLVGAKGKVFAFEPAPDNFFLLKKNIEANNYKNIVAVQKAVFDKTETIKLFLSENSSGDNRIYNPGDGRNKFINIEAIKLDDFFKNHNQTINIVKMDIQGAEGGVLKGMENLIKHNKNIKIFTEFGISKIKKENTFKITSMEYLKLLKKFGFYKIYYMNEQINKLDFFDINSLILNYPFKLDETVNFLCIHES